MTDKHVVVTGGAGFLGSHVVARLLAQGRRVRVVDDFSNGKEMHLADVIDDGLLEVATCDITRPDQVADAFAGADTVLHFAVLDLRQSIKDPHGVNKVIVDGTLNCLDAARDGGVDLFVNFSSSEVYGSAVRTPMDEDHPLLPETPYAAAKAAQDLYVRSYGQTYGLPWVTLRPFNMYGSNSHWQGFRGELIPKMIVRAMNGEPLTVFGDGHQTRDFTFVDDVAEAVCLALDRPSCRGQVFNICTGTETAISDIAEMICRAFELDPDTAIERQAPRPGDVHRHLGDNTRCRELLGYAPDTPFADGLALTIDWFRSLPLSPEELLAEEVARSWE